MTDDERAALRYARTILLNRAGNLPKHPVTYSEYKRLRTAADAIQDCLTNPEEI